MTPDGGNANYRAPDLRAIEDRHDGGRRWARFGQLNAGHRPTLVVTEAVLAALVAISVVNQHNPAHSGAKPIPPSAGTPLPVPREHLIGTWYSQVKVTSRYRDLRGSWVLQLGANGRAGLDLADGRVHVAGRWAMSAGVLSLYVRIPGCSPGVGRFQPETSPFGRWIVVSAIPEADPCFRRDAVFEGRWFPTPDSG